MNQLLMYFWLILALVFVLFEITHPGLFLCLSFAIGACLAAVASYFGFDLIVQSAVAIVGTFVGFLLLYAWLKAMGDTGQPHGTHSSNVYALPGKRAVVTKAIMPDQFGQVKINGEVWSARAVHNETIAQGALVEVVYLRGAHVVVKEIK